MYLSSYIPKIFYQKFTGEEIINESSFKNFSYLYLVCNVICLLNFVLNIFDINVMENSSQNVHPINSISSFDPE
jgi:hypothetical protein